MEKTEQYKQWEIKKERLDETEKLSQELVKCRGDKILCKVCDHVLSLKTIVRSIRYHYIKHGIHLRNLCHKCFRCYPKMSRGDLHKHSLKCSNVHFLPKCSKCGLKIQSVVKFRTHECQTCEYCKGKFSNSVELKVHLKICAAKNKIYSCHKCRKIYMGIAGLNSHLCNRYDTYMQTISSHERKIECRPEKTGRNTQYVFWEK